MKQKYLYLLFIIFSFLSTYSQADGDFRSKATGDWETVSSWEVYSGGWTNATSYPGQINGNYAVTITAGNTITVSTNLVTTTIGDLTVNGTLNLLAGSNPKQVDLKTPLLYLSASGVLNFSNQKTQLYLPNNAVIKIDAGGAITGACSNNTEIYIDNKLIAVCNGSGNSNILTFGEIVAGSGTLNANITNPADFSSTLCNGTNITLTGGYTGTPNGTVTYLWTVKDPTNTDVTIANNTSTSTSFTPTLSGLYSISFIVTDGTSFSNTETKTVTIQSVVTAGTIATSQTICSGTAPNTLTSTTDGTGDGTITYEWQTNASGSYQTIGGATAATYSPPVLTTTTSYQRRTVSTLNGVACYSPYTTPVTITVGDTTPPTASNPTAITVQCLSAVPAPDVLVVTDEADNCTTPTVTFVSQTANPLVNDGTITRTYRINDGNGNTTDVTQNIIIDDNTPPTASNPATITVQCLSAVPAPDVLVVNDEADNCTTPTVTFVSQTANPLVNDGTIIRTYRINDGNGNTIDVTQNIIIDDNTPPTASNPTAITVQCLSAVPVPNVLVVTDEADNCTTPTVTFVSQTANPLVNDGTITRTYRVDDGNGNTIDVTQNIIIDDNTPPTASNPTAITVQCLSAVPAPDVLVVNDEADNCTTPTVTFISQTANPLVNDGTIIRTYRINDGNGNTTDVTQNIIIDDTTPPTASNPTAITVQCLSAVPVPNVLVVTDEADNCTTPTVTFVSQTANPLVNDGTITRTYRINDGNGNTTDVTQNIIIDDNTPPTASNPTAITVQCLSAVPVPNVLVVNDEADNCTTPTVTFVSQTANPLVNDGTIIRTYRINDGNGNTIDVTQNIIIDDTTPPTASNPTAITVQCLSAVPVPNVLVVTDKADNCTTPTVTFVSQTANPLVNDGTITRTYRINDGNGNTTDVTQNIIIDDNTPPTASNPTAITVQCLSAVPVPNVLVVNDEADNCTTPTVTFVSQTANPLVNDGTIIRTYRINDGNGNTTDVTQNIIIDDNTPPTASNPTAITVQCLSAVPVPNVLVVNDEADNCTTPTVTFVSQTANPLVNDGTIIRTYRINDGNGNTIDVTQNIIIDDTTPPTASNPTAITVQCLSAVPVPNVLVVTDEADNCTTPTVTFVSQTANPLVNDGTIIRTYRINDGNGNTTDVTQNIIIDDNTPPTASNPTAITVQCLSAVPVPNVLVVNDEADNCTTPTVTFVSQTANPLVNDGTIIRTYRINDGNGNTIDVTQNIIIDDTTPPTASNPTAITVQCLSAVPVPNVLVVTDEADNCTTPTVTFVSQTANPLVNDGTITRTYRINDGNGNTTDVTQNIIIDDNTPPTASNPTAITVQCLSAVPVPNVLVVNDEADNCTTPTVTFVSQTANPLVNDGTIIRTYRINDGNGNTTDVTQNIIIDDTTPPTLTTISNKNENIGASCNFTIPNYTGLTTATDNCTSTASIIKTQSPAAGTIISGHNTTQLITITANDGNGNTQTTTFIITLKDTTLPTITCPSNKTAFTNNDGSGNCNTVVALGTPTATDNCTTAGNFTFVAKVGGVIINPATYLFGTGNTTVVWTATDQAGNISAPCNQTVTITDNEAPTISCPGNINANTSANGTGDCYTTVNIGTPVTNDNCGIASVIARVSGTIINTATYQFPIGSTIVTWTVTDNAGLTASCNQTITVIDNENPSISCPGDQNVNYNNNCEFSLQDYTSLATASDNCDSSLTITQSPDPGTLITAATTIVTLTARDDANRTSSCTFTVTAIDNIAPTAVCKNYTAYLSSTGTINVAAVNLDNGSNDNCGIANMTVTPNAFTCNNVGPNNVVFTVYDNNGNSNSCNAVITVVDNTAPTMICKNFIVVIDPISRVATIKASDIDNGSNDACGIASLSVSPSTFADSPNIYTTTTTLTAVDVNGNSNYCTATVTVEPPKNLFTYLTGVIVNPVPDNPQPPSALVEVTACPGGITVPKDIQFTLQPIGTYNLQASHVLNWEYSNDNGETWISIPNTAGLLTYTLTGLTSDTFVRLRITDADNTSLIKTSAEAYARFLPPDEPPIIVSHTALDICLGDSVTVNAESFYDQPEGQFGKGGKFNYAQPDGWRVDGLDGFFPASGNNNTEPTWKETNSTSNPNTTFSGINYDTSDNTKFAIAHAAEANRITTLETPVFSTIGMTSSEAILTFYTAYYFCNGGFGKIELSFDAGNTYTVTLNTMQNDVLTAGNTTGVKAYKGSGGSACNKQYLVADAFRYTSINLGPYAGLAGLRVRFTFNSGPSGGSCNNATFPKHSSNNCTNTQTFNVGSTWAIDDVGFTFGTVDDELEWTDEDGNVIATGTTATVTPVTPGIREYGVTTLVNGCRTDNDAGTNYVNINTSLAYAGEDYIPLASNCGENTLQLNAYDNTVSAVTNYNKGAWKNNLYVVPDTASGDTDYPGTGITGTWTVTSASTSSCGNSAVFSSATDPNAIFTADPGSYTLRWTLTNGCFDEINITIIDCKSVDFDGTNDYVSFRDNYNLNSAFSIEAWVKPNATNGTKTVFSRKDNGNNSSGYDLSIVSGQVQFNWYTNSGANNVNTGSYSIGTDRWYHLAVTFDGATYKLYVDGIELASKNGTAPAVTANTIEALLGAMDQSTTNSPVNYFHGWIDEFKIWNKALGVEQIRQMMNQEIDISGSDVGGVVIPMKIYGSDNDQNGVEDNPLLWNDLLGYYRMNTNCGDLTAYKGISGRLYNINSSQQQTAPIPYTSRVSNQTWNTDTTWTNFDVWNVPNSPGINNQPIDWNIVKLNHQVTSNTQDLTLLGLIVLSNELIITNSGTQNETNPGHGLWITHYLKLDGKIDLIGESQLVQKRYNSTQFSESIFEESSTGFIEIDQQGKKNSFNYNYWSSPVSNRGAANNSTYAMFNILRDGTDSANPKAITFGDGPYFADGPLSSPIKISNRWIWTYSSLTPASNSNWDNYWQWQYKASTGLIAAADGFTMKGTGGTAAITATQNYVFTGKPNSGTINKFIAINQTYLVGNPYPSALDADEFIKDNLKDCTGCRGTVNTFGGALYFWDHFGLSNNHVLAQYEGGYATYTLTGGVAAIANDPLNVNNGATGSKIPQRYIPVGQAFYIGAVSNGIVQGGTFTFKNSQRAFVRESSGNSIFMKVTNDKNSFAAKETVDKRMKIRLGFDTPIATHRQILVGTDPNTTNQFDFGYDARMIEVNDNDMYWELDNTPFIIQGIPNFGAEQIIPLGIKIANEGQSSIKIDALENVPNNIDIYLYDNVTKVYHDLRKTDFDISLAVGEYSNRFSLQFANRLTSIDETTIENGIIAYYTNENQLLNIRNYFSDVTITSVSLFNILKQNIDNWKITDSKQNHLKLPVKTLSSAMYLVHIKTDKGEYTQKIIIK